MGWQRFPISALLRKSEDCIHPEPDQIYQQIRVRLWGKGLILRAKIPGANLAANRQLRASAGQFLISRIDARHGAFGIVPDHLDGALVSNDFPCFDIDDRVVLPRYLEWYSRTEQFVALCRQVSEGSTNRIRLKVPAFMATDVLLPSLSAQRKTVAQLDKVSILIANALTVAEGIEQDVHSFAENVHFELAEPAERRLADFLELWEDRIPVEPTQHYPQVGVRSFSKGLFFKGSVLGTDTTYRSFNRLRQGLFVVSQPKGWEGAAAVCTTGHKGWYVSPEYRTFRCREGLLDEQYLAALLPTRWFQHALSKLTRGQGARRQRIRPDMLLDMPIRMPKIKLQRAVLLRFGTLGSIQHIRDDSVTDLRSLQCTVLQRIFEGHPV